ncbi:hypothetical protein I552_1863 [Mycobacterium xenopi 3993]|nr:hypothetical protein I552_1863 [Mycobacterium xenopi 3993]
MGFLFLYPAFVAKAHEANAWVQVGMLGLIGAAAGLGNFAGNFASARLQLGRPPCWWCAAPSRSPRRRWRQRWPATC